MGKFLVTIKSVSTNAFSLALVSLPKGTYRIVSADIDEGGLLRTSVNPWEYHNFLLASEDFDRMLRELEGN